MEIDWNVFMGERVWPMIDRRFHDQRYHMDENWAIYRVIDHGIRHPTCCLWFGINKNGDRHFFREYYAVNKSIPVNTKEVLRLSNEAVVDTIIDPSTRKRINYISSAPSTEKKGLRRQLDIYCDHGISCSLADNSAAGYDKVTNGLLSQLARKAIETGEMPLYLEDMHINQEQLLMLSSAPAISFDLRFVSRAFNEMINLRWKQLTGDPGERSEPEKTVDVADEGPDCVRYAMQTDLYWRRPATKPPRGSYLYELRERYRKRKRQKIWL